MSRARERAMSLGYCWEIGYMGWISPEEQMEADAEAEAAERDEDEEKDQ